MTSQNARLFRAVSFRWLFLVLMLFAGGKAGADVIQVTWSGFVSSEFNVPGIQSGDLVSGSFEYESCSSGIPQQGGFFIYDTNLQMDYSVNGIAGSTSNLDFTLLDGTNVTVPDNVQIRIDQYIGSDVPVSSGVFAMLGGSIQEFQFRLTDQAFTALTSSRLPTSLSAADGWDVGNDCCSEHFISWSNGSQLTFTINALTSQNLSNLDLDCDGVGDVLDNCIAVPNMLQRDSDGDGHGNRCDGDLNQDCIVNPVDLGIFRSVFFTDDANGDLNGDGVVNPVDLGIFRSLFFEPPGPSPQGSLCNP